MKASQLSAITSLVAIATTCAASGAPRFTLVELPVLDNSAYESVATGINERGDISVYAQRHQRAPRRYVALVCPSNRDQCKLLDHPVSGHHFGAVANAINEAGVVAGFDSFRRDEMATLWLDRHTPVGLEPDHVTFPRAYALNDDNVVVGGGQDAFGWQAQVWKEGVVTKIEGLGGRDVHARGINNAGIVAGSSLIANQVNVHAYAYNIGTGQITDLGTIDGGHSRAFAINSNGDITGSATVHNDVFQNWPMSKAVDGEMKSLGMLGTGKSGEGLAINDTGDIVGSIETLPDDELSRHGFLYHEDVLYDLNDLVEADQSQDYTVTSGRGINNAGDVVGAARRNGDGRLVAVKLVRVR